FKFCGVSLVFLAHGKLLMSVFSLPSYNILFFQHTSDGTISAKAGTINLVNTATTTDDSRGGGGGSIGILSIASLLSLIAYRRYRK
ncbi:GlyGly-CTERM sorting domain-containing protein, partial [Acinetobacter baumannii]|uniref:GlyGly-CTERM sorting domain-containing protein n=2 Tax=Acinetobacter baumannii TaxID=470 RepID=UPI0024B8104F